MSYGSVKTAQTISTFGISHKPISNARFIIDRFSVGQHLSNQRPATAGYNSRTMDFPLKVAQILPEDSKSHRQIQFADLLAGSSCYFLRNESHKIDGTFESSLKKVLFDKKLIAHVLWPSDDITPESLDALDLHEAETNLNDYTARVLSGDPEVMQ